MCVNINGRIKELCVFVSENENRERNAYQEY